MKVSGPRLCVGQARSHPVRVLDDMACMSLGSHGSLRVKGSGLYPQQGNEGLHRKPRDRRSIKVVWESDPVAPY